MFLLQVFVEAGIGIDLCIDFGIDFGIDSDTNFGFDFEVGRLSHWFAFYLAVLDHNILPAWRGFVDWRHGQHGLELEFEFEVALTSVLCSSQIATHPIIIVNHELIITT